MHIGICDDEENVRAYIRKLIEQQNEECQITEYASGEELLQAEKENSEKIDVLFLDIAMGDIDGMNVHDDRECVTALKYWIGIYIKFADKWAADNIGYCHFDLQYCPI